MTILSFFSSTSVGATSLDILWPGKSNLNYFTYTALVIFDIVGFMPNRYWFILQFSGM